MRKYTLLGCAILTFSLSSPLALAQIDEGDTGAWYMYLLNTKLNDSNFGFQGDIQHRN
jgi:hypothetical protein